MTVVEHCFRLLLIDDERVVLMQNKDFCELPKRESDCALRLIRFNPKGETKLNYAPHMLSELTISVLQTLSDDGKQLTVREIGERSQMKPSTTANQLYKLERTQLASRTTAENPHLWWITATGRDFLADITSQEADQAHALAAS